jgi:hypothetical protein
MPNSTRFRRPDRLVLAVKYGYNTPNYADYTEVKFAEYILRASTLTVRVIQG